MRDWISRRRFKRMVERAYVTVLHEDGVWTTPPAHLQSCIEGDDLTFTFTPEGTPEQVAKYRDELRRASQMMWEFFATEQRIMAAR